MFPSIVSGDVGRLIAGCGGLIGVMLVVAGLVTTQAALVAGVIISIVGFLTMVGGATSFIRRPRG